MKTVVLYESKYGATRKYAQWISEELGCELFERSRFKPENLKHYDTVLYGGGLYAGGVAGSQLLVKNFSLLEGKRVAVFTVGLADPSNPENIANIRKGLDRIFTPDQQSRITFFHLRGGMDYSRLTFMDRLLMSMLKKIVAKKSPAEMTDEERELLETFGKSVDYTDRQTIGPVVEFAKQGN